MWTLRAHRSCFASSPIMGRTPRSGLSAAVISRSHPGRARGYLVIGRIPEERALELAQGLEKRVLSEGDAARATRIAWSLPSAHWAMHGRRSDGTRVVTAPDDKTARLWDAATGKEIAVLRGHDDTVRSAAFSPDGTRVVTASDDKTARLWDAATGKEIVALRGHDNTVWSAAFSPEPRRRHARHARSLYRALRCGRSLHRRHGGLGAEGDQRRRSYQAAARACGAARGQGHGARGAWRRDLYALGGMARGRFQSGRSEKKPRHRRASG